MAAARRARAASAASADSEPLAFEAALARLEEIVARLEAGELDLEAALAAFEEGVALTRRCAAQLEAAERRVEVLVREGAGWSEQPFEPGGEED